MITHRMVNEQRVARGDVSIIKNASRSYTMLEVKGSW